MQVMKALGPYAFPAFDPFTAFDTQGCVALPGEHFSASFGGVACLTCETRSAKSG